MADESKYPTRIAPYGLRMPPELKERVDAAAKANNRSMNAEIVARLEASLSPKDGSAVPRDTSPMGFGEALATFSMNENPEIRESANAITKALQDIIRLSRRSVAPDETSEISPKSPPPSD